MDVFFPFWTDVQKQPFVLVLLPFLLVYLYRVSGRCGISLVVLALVLSAGVDSLVSFIKPFFARLRPSDPSLGLDAVLRISPQGGFSFPSGHAADAFFIAAFIGYFFPRARWPLVIVAFLTAYSRVYCGVHFPVDIVGGALLGAVLAILSALAVEKLYLACVGASERRLK
jgi:undecaprenyl-diphosphatase